MEDLKVIKKIGNTDFNYKIITAGAKFAVPKGLSIRIMYNGKEYSAKMHSTSAGRIDGLAAWYKENNIKLGDEIVLTYNAFINVIYIEKSQSLGSVDEEKFEISDKIWQQLEKEKTMEELKGIFDSFDMVAIHQEYYLVYRAEHTVVNGNWIFYWDETPYLMDESGERKIELDIDEKLKWAWCLGMNRKGIWFMNYKSGACSGPWDDTQWWNEIICINPVTNSQRKIKFNTRKASISKCYIYGDDIYYVAASSENRQKLIWINQWEMESEVYVTYKEESFGNISAYSSMVAFEIITNRDKDVNHWCIYNTKYNQTTELGLQRDPKKNWLPLFSIKFIDLKNKIMWTSMTEDEQSRFSADCNDFVARPLAEMAEYKVLKYKSINAPAIFKIPRSVSSSRYLLYFDGKDAYATESFYRLRRIDWRGNIYEVGKGRHGECDKIVVGDKFLYVNYDAFTAVRLPRKFSSSDQYGRENPEAGLIFGLKDYRL